MGVGFFCLGGRTAGRPIIFSVDDYILAKHSGLCDEVSTTCCAVGSIPEGLRDRHVELAYLGIVLP